MHVRTKGRIAGVAFLVVNAVMANAGPAVVTADPVIGHAARDTHMNTAQRDARNSLGAFLAAALDDTGTSLPDTGLKVAFQTPAGLTEVIWIARFKQDGNGFTGHLANRPMHMDGAAGDPVSFDRGAIRDWFLIGDDGRMYGSFTTRAMLPEMSPEAVRSVQALLSPAPLPAGW